MRAPVRFAAGLALAVILLAAAVGTWRTFGVVGAGAVTAMDAAERDYLTRLRSLHRGMSEAAVIAHLGAPEGRSERMAQVTLSGFAAPGAALSGVSVRFDATGARAVSWIKLGHFSYRYALEPPPAVAGVAAPAARETRR